MPKVTAPLYILPMCIAGKLLPEGWTLDSLGNGEGTTNTVFQKRPTMSLLVTLTYVNFLIQFLAEINYKKCETRGWIINPHCGLCGCITLQNLDHNFGHVHCYISTVYCKNINFRSTIHTSK